MPHSQRTTAWDLVERLMSSLGGNVANASARDFRTCILDAYREIEAIHPWEFLVNYLRLALNGKFPSSTLAATIAYDATGGAYERLLTLSGSIWPAWTQYGAIRLNGLIYQISQVIDSTRLQLAEGYAPSADLDAGTTFTLFRDTYTLPEDVVAFDKGVCENTWGALEHIRPQEWLVRTRYMEAYAAPHFWTVRGDPKVPGRLAMSVFPYPDVDQTLDLIYHRTMRAITVFEQKTGAASIAANSTTVTLSGTTFKAANVGDVIRLSIDKTVPSDLAGDSPFAFEGTIMAVTDAANAVVDQAPAQTFTETGYRLSSPIDLEPTAMLNAFIACCHRYLGRQRRYKPPEQEKVEKAFLFSLRLAQEADSRDSSQRAVDIREMRPVRPYIQVWG